MVSKKTRLVPSRATKKGLEKTSRRPAGSVMGCQALVEEGAPSPDQMFKSIKNFHQPNEKTCEDITLASGVSQQNGVGTCNFNYYSHAIGAGARYNTPVGPIRVDFSYNLNPPTYPVFYDYTTSLPYVGHGSHFNFFFSIGQSF